jgi:hypothetical protein
MKEEIVNLLRALLAGTLAWLAFRLMAEQMFPLNYNLI